MIYKTLGNTQVKISAIGQGTIGAGSYQNTTSERIRRRIDVLRLGIELGITFLDTGEDYEEGHAEELLGKAIKGIRGDVFISSKFKPSNNSFTGVMNAIEGSLRRLQTDYIDLYQVQWPNPLIPISETMASLSNLVDQEKIRFVGVSNFTQTQLEEAQLFFDRGKIVSVQTEYNLRNRSIESDLLPYCESNQINVIAYSPFNQGNLYLDTKEKETLSTISEKYGATISQVILNWLISHPAVVAVTSTMSSTHISENAGATDFKLHRKDIKTIAEAFTREPILVPTDRIRIIYYDIDETHRIYTTLNEAIENRLNLQPSPMVLAQEVKEGNRLKPVELVLTKDKTGKYDYDLTHGRSRYWAWIIANGPEKPIPAYIIERKSLIKRGE